MSTALESGCKQDMHFISLVRKKSRPGSLPAKPFLPDRYHFITFLYLRYTALIGRQDCFLGLFGYGHGEMDLRETSRKNALLAFCVLLRSCILFGTYIFHLSGRDYFRYEEEEKGVLLLLCTEAWTGDGCIGLTDAGRGLIWVIRRRG